MRQFLYKIGALFIFMKTTFFQPDIPTQPNDHKILGTKCEKRHFLIADFDINATPLPATIFTTQCASD